MRDATDDLWLSAEAVRQRVTDWLSGNVIPEITVAEVAEEAFGILYPNRSVRTQIGQALVFLGWQRIERRTKRPRFVYRKP
jgi:hypothetical protein